MRQVQRHRHSVPRGVAAVLTPLFRYSASRDAYVLRGVGNRLGPVIKSKV